MSTKHKTKKPTELEAIHALLAAHKVRLDVLDDCTNTTTVRVSKLEVAQKQPAQEPSWPSGLAALMAVVVFVVLALSIFLFVIGPRDAESLRQQVVNIQDDALKTDVKLCALSRSLDLHVADQTRIDRMLWAKTWRGNAFPTDVTKYPEINCPDIP